MLDLTHLSNYEAHYIHMIFCPSSSFILDDEGPSTHAFHIFELKSCSDILWWITIFWKLVLKLFFYLWKYKDQTIDLFFISKCIYTEKYIYIYFFFIEFALVVSYFTRHQCTSFSLDGEYVSFRFLSFW